jgi:tetratricopeptide (TPR) repeat protein/transcriptional regulator with XRE-family HTH domain
MRGNRRKPEHIALALLRVRFGWDKKELARTAGCHPNKLTDLESGRRELSRAELEDLASLMGSCSADVDTALEFVRETDPYLRVPGSRAGDLPGVEGAVHQASEAMEGFLRRVVTLCTNAAGAAAVREEARRQWVILCARSTAEQRTIVQKSREYRSWGLCELICHESERAASQDAPRALELADVALLIAERTPGGEAWRWRVQGYAWAHIASARIALGELSAAEWAFAKARELWKAGEVGDPNRFLDEARFLRLEASLLREHGHLDEALSCIEDALQAVPGGELTPHLLADKAALLELKGSYEQALAALEQISPCIEADRDPRLLRAQRMGLVKILCHLDRAPEAAAFLPELRRLTGETGGLLDHLQLRWLEGRVAAGRGRLEEASVILANTRQEFANCHAIFYAAVVTIELAVLYLKTGRSTEIKLLAGHLDSKARGIHSHALDALGLFIEAVEQDKISIPWAENLVRYLYQSQGNPMLRFQLSL